MKSPDRPLTSDDEFVEITRMTIKEIGFTSKLGYWNDFNPKKSKPHSFIGVLEVYPTSHSMIITNMIAKIEMRPHPPHWTTMAVIFDDGGVSSSKRDEINAYDPNSFEQLRNALIARARVSLGKPDWKP